MDVQIIAAPLIGGLIGLITNSLAIKMLFRPHKEVRILGFHLPFTPGLIPKEKPRIAHAISQVISSYILDNDTILAALASDPIKKAYETKYEEKVAEWKSLDITYEELLKNYHLLDQVNVAETKLRDSIGKYVVDKCLEEDIIRKMMDHAFIRLKDNMNPFMYKMSKNALTATKESIIEHLEGSIASQGEEFIGSYVDTIYVEGLDKPVNELVISIEKKYPDMKQMLWDRYIDLIKNKSGQFLSTLNIQKVIEDKINEYDIAELEKMIMEISKKELQALIWLGGLLGVFMGFINLLF